MADLGKLILDKETFDWLVTELEKPPKVIPELAELLEETPEVFE